MSSDPRSIIRKVLITEKGTVMRETLRQYFFEVARDANKIEIKRAVEAVFHVKVDSVQTMQMQGKVKRRAAASAAQRLEEGHRDAQARSEDRAVRADLATRNDPWGSRNSARSPRRSGTP
jgi:large subunit ribosomal protein L23